MSNRIHFLLITLIDILLVYSTVTQTASAAIVAFVLTVVAVLAGSGIQAFYTLLGTCFFSGVYNVSSIGVYFIVTILCCVKLLANRATNKNVLLLGIVLAILCALHDLPYHTIGGVVNSSVMLLSMFAILSNKDWRNYDHKYSTWLLLISIVIVQVGAILLSGDLTQMSDESVSSVRMGEGDVEGGMNNTLGGAMGFPISTLLFVTCSFPLLFGKQARILSKFLLGVLDIVLLIVTFFTTSRVYLLGLAVFFVCIIGEFFVKGSKSKVWLIVILIGAVVVFYALGIYNLIFERYAARIVIDDVSTGRFDIYKDCLSYLVQHPLALLFGEGRAYSEIGRIHNYAFGMSAHNIILDWIMAYGIFGLVILLSVIKRFVFSLKENTNFDKSGLLGYMPLICWFVMCLTNTPFILPKTFVLIPFMLLHSRYYKTLMNKE